MLNNLNWVKLPNESGNWLIEFLVKGFKVTEESQYISISLYDYKNHPDKSIIENRDKISWPGPDLFGFIPKISDNKWAFDGFKLIDEIFENWKYEKFSDIPFGKAWILRSLKLSKIEKNE